MEEENQAKANMSRRVDRFEGDNAKKTK